MVDDVEIVFDEDGFVKNPSFWSERLAAEMAKKQFNIELTKSHLDILNFVRNYYLKWGGVPMVKTIRERMKISNVQLDVMFKRGKSSSRGIICKLSGLPKMLCISSGC